jgi:small subunit ribosomal protein S20
LPHHKSAKKRLKTAQLAREANKSTRSSIFTGLRKIRSAKSKEEILTKMPKLFSLIDKASNKHRAGFTPNKAANLKRGVHKLLQAPSS